MGFTFICVYIVFMCLYTYTLCISVSGCDVRLYGVCVYMCIVYV